MIKIPRKTYLWTTLIFMSLILSFITLYLVTSIRYEYIKFKQINDRL